jgi:hypothetical protein
MTRRGPGLKFDGSPCKRCGSTLRYVSTKQCVHCCNSRDRSGYMRDYTADDQNVRGYQAQLKASHRRTVTPESIGSTSTKILAALSKDAHSALARQSRMYLGIPKHQKELVKPPPMTTGDHWRASLPVGAETNTRANLPPTARMRERPIVPYELSAAQRRDEYVVLAAIIADMVPTLPDVVIPKDIISRLDPEMVEKFGKRLPINLSHALMAAGATRRAVSTAGILHARVYFLRCGDAYQAMSGKSFLAHRDAGTYTKPGDPLPTGAPRQPGRRGKGPAMSLAERRQRGRERERRKAAAARAAKQAAERRLSAEYIAGKAAAAAVKTSLATTQPAAVAARSLNPQSCTPAAAPAVATHG